jgi:hypothetical protein
MPEENRIYDGFGDLSGGMNGGEDASLIAANQCALAVNMSFRDSFAAVRPSFSSIPMAWGSAPTTLNLIPVGATYVAGPQGTYGVTNLVTTGISYTLFWGANENSLHVGSTIYRQQDYPKQITFTVPAGGVSITLFNTTSGATPVTAVLAPSNITGYFQGACFYQSAQPQQSGFVVSVSGRLFQITLGTSVTMKEITPQVALVTISDFSVPTSSNNPVNININNDAGFLTTGSIFYIDSGKFQVTGVFGNQLATEYLGGYTAPTVNIATTSAFTVPAPSANVTIQVNNPGALSPTGTVYMFGGQYTIVSVTGDSIVLTYVSGSTVTTVVAGTALTNVSGTPFTYSNYMILAGASLTDGNGNQLFFNGANPASLQYVNLYQAENYVIILAGQNSTQIFDGSTVSLAGVEQLPPGLFGTYQWGRNWITLNDGRSFVASDLVGDPSGTAKNDFVDAILYMTENNFLAGGGAFKVPNNQGLITAMGALPTLDTSLGAGQILVGTTNSIIGVNAPPDRTTWQNLTYPIQSISTMGYGPIGPNCMFPINGDIWFRSLDGIRSFQIKRRDFQKWSDAPESQELYPILSADTPYLLFYGSGTGFNNKGFHTVSPYQTQYGICHRGLAVINFDLISDLRTTKSPAWDGVYTGLQILQIVYGIVDGVERCFLFVLNSQNSIELWEIKTSGKYDTVHGNGTISYTPIQSQMNTRRMDFQMPEQLKTLYTAELYLDQISDNVTITIKWLPDEYPTWTEWVTLNFACTQQQCTLSPPPATGQCNIFRENSAQYAARIMLTTPPEVVNALNNGYLHNGHEFQFRFEGTGHFRIRKFKVHAVPRSQRMEGELHSSQCNSVPVCNLSIFGYDSHGQ